MYTIIDKLQKESEKGDIYILGGIIRVSNRRIEQVYYIDEIPESIINKLRFRIIGSKEFQKYLSEEDISITDINYIRCDNGLKTIEKLLDILHLDEWFSLIKKALNLKFRYSDEKEEKQPLFYIYNPSSNVFEHLEVYVADFVINDLLRESKIDEIYIFGGTIKIKNRKFYYLKYIDILFFEQYENNTLSHYYKDAFSQKMLEYLKVKIKDLKYIRIPNKDAIHIIKEVSIEKKHINRLKKLKTLLSLKIKSNEEKQAILIKYLVNLKHLISKYNTKIF